MVPCPCNTSRIGLGVSKSAAEANIDGSRNCDDDPSHDPMSDRKALSGVGHSRSYMRDNCWRSRNLVCRHMLCGHFHHPWSTATKGNQARSLNPKPQPRSSNCPLSGCRCVSTIRDPIIPIQSTGRLLEF